MIFLHLSLWFFLFNSWFSCIQFLYFILDSLVVNFLFSSFHRYETSGGISAQEAGTLKNAGSDNEIMSVQGSYQYTGPDGIVYKVTYIADENGFQPQGDHIPK